MSRILFKRCRFFGLLFSFSSEFVPPVREEKDEPRITRHGGQAPDDTDNGEQIRVNEGWK